MADYFLNYFTKLDGSGTKYSPLRVLQAYECTTRRFVRRCWPQAHVPLAPRYLLETAPAATTWRQATVPIPCRHPPSRQSTRSLARLLTPSIRLRTGPKRSRR